MTECIVSLKLGERFEEKDGVNWELGCKRDTKGINASDSIATEKGFLIFYSLLVLIFSSNIEFQT